MNGLQTAIVEKIYKNHTADIKYRTISMRQTNVRIAGQVYWNLQVRDLALVGFLDDNNADPIIIDKLMNFDHKLIEDSEVDDIHLRHIVTKDTGNKNVDGSPILETTGEIEFHTDKDGNLTINLSGKVGNMALNLSGDEGKLAINSKGNIALETEANLTAKVAGKVSIQAEKEVSVEAAGKVMVESADIVVVTGAKGVELGDNLKKELVCNLKVCIVTGAPHNIGNTKVTV